MLKLGLEETCSPIKLKKLNLDMLISLLLFMSMLVLKICIDDIMRFFVLNFFFSKCTCQKKMVFLPKFYSILKSVLSRYHAFDQLSASCNVDGMLQLVVLVVEEFLSDSR